MLLDRLDVADVHKQIGNIKLRLSVNHWIVNQAETQCFSLWPTFRQLCPDLKIAYSSTSQVQCKHSYWLLDEDVSINIVTKVEKKAY